MIEFRTNQYVIEIIRKRGATEYNFIATPAAWRKVVGQVSAARSYAELNPRNLPPSTLKHMSNAFNEYATISRGKSSRVTFEIRIADGLEQVQEKTPLWESIKITAFVFYLLAFALGVLYCAFVGLVFIICTLLSLFRH